MPLCAIMLERTSSNLVAFVFTASHPRFIRPLQASLGMSFAVGPLLGTSVASLVSRRFCFALAASMAVLNLAYVALILPETRAATSEGSLIHASCLPKLSTVIQANPAIDGGHAAVWRKANPISALAVLGVTPRMRGITMIAACHFMAMWCKIATLLLYLRGHFHVSQSEMGTFMTMLGTCFMVSQVTIAHPAPGVCC